jgi:hypothetical protein
MKEATVAPTVGISKSTHTILVKFILKSRNVLRRMYPGNLQILWTPIKIPQNLYQRQGDQCLSSDLSVPPRCSNFCRLLSVKYVIKSMVLNPLGAADHRQEITELPRNNNSSKITTSDQVLSAHNSDSNMF